ncbi:aminodeoxychorismate synthase component I [Capillimicrobium parvum]|uniref:Isochorismate synthase MenF n=1 Tax=Capillimicrobium parvum TaxID=2884022 RepID=A0A9E6XZL1_9ACTN|nr:aminodeoxychorismate synthase component I [Capillimicrobium parvum]UGS37385.1 Isochorismate synthase MenF [Capillimicrobium parvum]
MGRTGARLVAEPLDVDWTPAEAVLALRGDDRPFALTGAWAGSRAVLGSQPIRVAGPDEDPFAVLDEQPAVTGAGEHRGAVGGGWFGHLGFALGHLVERLAPAPPARTALPPFALAFYDHVLRLDADGRWWFEALETPERAEALVERRARLAARRPGAPRPFRAGPFVPAPPGAAGLRAGVAECVERIHGGELFQANLTMRIEGPFAGDPLDAFAAGLALEPRHGALFAGPWGATVGLSPELFLRRRGREVVTRPIKGTIRRDADEDGARRALVGSAKDRAENVMIVDLMRNDLGRVCAYGSVHAGGAPVAEAHPGVWHLVSEVRGRLRDGVGDGELLRATFPPGSVTGAPKVQALHVIAELEGAARHVYTGAVGFASPVAGLELNVAIRTFEVRDGVAWIGAGGGIVADSDPDAEVAEALGKARPLIAALGTELRPGPLRGGRVPAPRALAGGRRRPDAALGVIETLAVLDGRPVEPEAHLARLRASVEELYAAALPGDLAERTASSAAGAGDGYARLRIDVVPGRLGSVDVEVAVAGAAHPAAGAAPVRVEPVRLPGGLGPHKWRDRRLVQALQAELGAIALLVDADGAVLEAAMANVWLVEGDELVTPPADGRILAGCTRARALALPQAREEAFGLDRLEAADGVLLTSSIALVRVVDSGRAAPPLQPVAALRDAVGAAVFAG